LKIQREKLVDQRGFFFIDEDISNALSLVDVEIENVQGELARLSRAKQKDREK
jgi:hypothetical protein